MNEPLRYLNNAKETLCRSSIEENQYTDDKYVKSACGIAYLGVLKAIEDSLLKKGLSKKELPKKVEEYRKAMLHSTDVVKGVFKTAKAFIRKINQ
jgi:hypothetical protein